jgi:adenine-specific DNA-methyltransferase
MPLRRPHSTVALAAVLLAASRASASPGHTAQPFQPTERLLPHINLAWNVGIREEIRKHTGLISSSYAKTRGEALVGEGLEYLQTNLRDGDLVFCDPPYSSAQYGRFYHVLEGIARGGWESVSGAGRAPTVSARASSLFSLKSSAATAATELMDALAAKRVTALWTYPEGERSNGLTVDYIREEAGKRFAVDESRVPMRHSTLGGSNLGGLARSSRHELYEVLFCLSPA